MRGLRGVCFLEGGNEVISDGLWGHFRATWVKRGGQGTWTGTLKQYGAVIDPHQQQRRKEGSTTQMSIDAHHAQRFCGFTAWNMTEKNLPS